MAKEDRVPPEGSGYPPLTPQDSSPGDGPGDNLQSPMRRTQVYLRPSDCEAIYQRALSERCTKSSVIRRAIRAFLRGSPHPTKRAWESLAR